jgi:transcriptional regulator with XRE-family HTH domain
MGHMPDWWKNITPFGEVLYARIHEAGMRPADFARKAGVTTAYLSQIRKGVKAKPPTARLDDWANLLGLYGEKREYFLDIAEISTASPRLLAMLDPGHAARPAINEAQMRVAEDAPIYDSPSLLAQEIAARDREISRLQVLNQDLQARLDQVRQAASGGGKLAAPDPRLPRKKA